jgi:hypothetical protein
MVRDDLVVDGDQCLIHAVTTLFLRSRVGKALLQICLSTLARSQDFPVFLLTNRVGKMSVRPRNRDWNNCPLPEGVFGTSHFAATAGRLSEGAVGGLRQALNGATRSLREPRRAIARAPPTSLARGQVPAGYCLLSVSWHSGPSGAAQSARYQVSARD